MAAASASPTPPPRSSRARTACCRSSRKPKPSSKPTTPQLAGQITIAAFATAARGLAPQAIRACARNIRQLAITFHEQEPHESIPRLVRRDVDVIIINDWQNAPIALPEGLTKAPLFDDVADIALPPGHRLAKSKSIRLSDLSGEEWIAWPSGSICHDFLLHTLRKEGHEPKIAHTAGEYETQLALVAAGLGCCVLPRLGRGAVPAGVTVVQSEPALRRHVYAAWRTHATRRTSFKPRSRNSRLAGKEQLGYVAHSPSVVSGRNAVVSARSM